MRGWVMDRRVNTWISGWKDAQMEEEWMNGQADGMGGWEGGRWLAIQVSD